MVRTTPPTPAWLNRLQRQAAIVGLAGGAVLAVGAFISPEEFFRAYLVAYLFWMGMAIGLLGVLMLHNLTAGAWGLVIRRLLEAGARTLPLMALLFLPIAAGLPSLYVWARPEAVAADPLLQYKRLYLNVPFFLLRALIYFVVWVGLGYFLTRWLLEEDREPDPGRARRIRLISAIGLILMVLTVTFAAFDWVMSLEPHWFSSIFGAIVGWSAVLGAFAFAIAAVAWLARREPLRDVMTPNLFSDLGGLLLAFVMLWAYLSFSQFMLIWIANLPEEVIFYLDRFQGGWEWLSLSLALFHFALPFVLLLSREVRADARNLALVAILLIFMHFVHFFWLVTPSLHEEGLTVHWLDFVAPIALGGIWVAAFVWQFKARPLVPPPALPKLRERAEAEYARH